MRSLRIITGQRAEYDLIGTCTSRSTGLVGDASGRLGPARARGWRRELGHVRADAWEHLDRLPEAPPTRFCSQRIRTTDNLEPTVVCS